MTGPSESILFRVVAIGASAGGIAALQSLFKALPGKTGLSFIVILHLPSESPSLLTDILKKATQLHIHQAFDGQTLEQDSVYIAQPGEVLTVEEGVLRSRPLTGMSVGGIDTIDTLFESLAHDLGWRAIAIILSGTGRDGAAGSICIKQSGGLVFVQEPSTAQYDGMPNAAIGTGSADEVLSLEEIARELLSCVSPGRTPLLSTSNKTDDDMKALEEILALLHRDAGHDFRGYKLSPIVWKIKARMSLQSLNHFSDYLDFLSRRPIELEALARNIPIRVTEFFRDKDVWNILGRDVIDPLIKNQTGDRLLRVWTPACSTGEEAYSIAMLLSEHTEKIAKSVDFKIFATDVSPEIVTRAKRGVFSHDRLQSIPPDMRNKFFSMVDKKYEVNRLLREKIIFAPQNLLVDPPFSDIDIVTCRNLLIYLEPAAQVRVLSIIHGALRMGGYLFLGNADSLSPKQRGFKPISFKGNIYQKIESAGFEKNKFLKHSASNESMVAESAHWSSLEKFNLPSVLIDYEFNILWVYGDTSEFVRLPSGEPVLNLMRAAKPGITVHLRAGVSRAMTESRSVLLDDLKLKNSKTKFSMRLTPLQSGEAGRSTRMLISFIPSKAKGTKDKSAETPVLRDLRTLEDDFQITIEEMEASREELRALNEELRAANEQLNTSHHELSELNVQLQEQSQVLSSGAVRTLFLDKELRVRWFTTAIVDLFPLRTTDIGGPIDNLVQKFTDERFINDVHKVLNTGEARENEVKNNENRWYTRRIRPFRENDLIKGVAITFDDITERKQGEEALRESEERFRALFAASPVPFMVLAPNPPDFIITAANEAYFAATQTTPESLIGRRLFDVFPDEPTRPGQLGSEALAISLDRVLTLRRTDAMKRVRYDLVTLDGFEPHWWEAINAPMLDASGNVSAIIHQVYRVTELHLAGEKEKERQRRQAFLLKLSDALRPLGDAEEIRLASATVLGRHLKAGRVAYAENVSDEQCFEVTRNYVDGVPEVTGRYRYADYGPDILEQLQSGQIRVQPDIQNDSRLSDAEKQALAEAKVGASLNVPLVKNGRLVAFLGVNYSAAHDFEPYEIELVKETAERTWAAVERAKVEAALRESEEKYRTLFETMDEGYLIGEVIFDEKSKAVDILYLQANPAAIRLAGRDFTGQRMRDIDPRYEEYWYETYGHVALTGEPVHAEHYVAPHGRWFEFRLSKVGGAESRRVASIFQDITERKQREQQQQYLLRLNDAIGPIADPLEIQAVAADLLGEHLDVNQAYYGERVGDDIYIGHAYANGLPPMTGKFRYEDFGKRLAEGCRSGQVQVCHDAATDPALSEEERQALASINMGAYIALPFIKNGDWVATLAVHSIRPRQWKQHEIELIKETAERTWSAVARARAEHTLRQSEERLRRVLDGMGEGFGLLAPDFTILEHNREALRMDGRSREEVVGRSHWDVFPGTESSELGKLLKKAMEERVAVSLEHRYAWEDEHALWLEMRAYPTDDGSLAVFWRDVSDRRNAQDALRKSEEKRAEAALRESEEKFRSVFETAEEGFCIIEVLFDGAGQPVDYRFLETNRWFQKQTGLANATGRTMRELASAHEQYWFDIYGRVAKTGESVRFENEAKELGFVYDVYAWRVGAPGENHVAIVFHDITARKQGEKALRESEERVIESMRQTVDELTKEREKRRSLEEALRKLKGKDE